MARKQSELKGMETPSAIPEIDAAAERLRAASKRRKKAQDAEVEAKALLLRLMEDNKLKIYEDHDCNPPLVVVLGEVKKITVEELKEGSAPDEEIEDGEEEPSAEQLAKLEGKASKKKPAEA